MAEGRGKAATPVAVSVVIPAHDEEAEITRLLDELAVGSYPGELEVVVACNGCTDRTADVARSHPAVGAVVVETPVQSKAAALDLGDRTATRFPRFYIDADVSISVDSLRLVAATLVDTPVLAAAPAIKVDTTDCGFVIRAYYRVWQQLDWAATSMIGSGVYALSAAGRGRFGPFPDVQADDLWISAQFADNERASVRSATFTIRASPSLSTLVRRKARILAYKRLVSDELRVAPGGQAGKGRGLLSVARSSPREIPAVAVYVAVGAVTNVVARRNVRRGRLTWTSDR